MICGYKINELGITNIKNDGQIINPLYSAPKNKMALKYLIFNAIIKINVPGAGVEPALPKELVFETSASTNSAIRA